MSLRAKTISIVSSVITLFSIIFIYMQIQERQKDYQWRIQQLQDSIYSSYKLVKANLDKEHALLASELLNSPQIKENFALGERDKVYHLSNPYFIQSKTGYVTSLSFIRADNVHFLRLHDPKHYGDNLSLKRAIIPYMNHERQKISSFEATLYGGNYISLFPVYHHDRYIGFIQIGTNMNQFYTLLNKECGSKSTLFFHLPTLEKMGLPKQGIVIDSFIQLSSNTPLFGLLPQNYHFNQRLELNFQETPYLITAKSIPNFKGEIIGWFVTANDISVLKDDFRLFLTQFILMTLLLLIIIIGTMYYAYANFMQELEKSQEQISHQLYFDTLTTLPNRMNLEKVLEEHHYAMLAIFNIDAFKAINDFYGTKIGDIVLQEVGKFLLNHLRESDENILVYRISGDEFAAIFERDFQGWSERIRDIINKMSHYPILLDDQEVFISLSCGAAIAEDGLIEKADMTLKEAKKRRKAFLMYDPDLELKREYANNIKWTKKVKEAINYDCFIPFFQPIISTQTGLIDKYEALVRLKDLDGTIISPFHFLTVAKKAKLYPFITEAMIEKTFDIFATLPLGVSLNLSVDDILDHETEALIFKNLRKFPHPERIVFEILESEGIENYSEIAHFIRNIKKMGAKIAIDDFGSGYSNFEHILRLHVDFIKIDASLIKHIDTDTNAQIVVQTIINFAKKLGIKTTAEFVHSQSVYNKCCELGFDFLQGYYLGEPIELTKETV